MHTAFLLYTTIQTKLPSFGYMTKKTHGRAMASHTSVEASLVQTDFVKRMMALLLKHTQHNICNTQ